MKVTTGVGAKATDTDVPGKISKAAVVQVIETIVLRTIAWRSGT